MKKYLLGLLVAVFALGTSAFTANRTNDKVSTLAKVWFYSPSGMHTATSDPEAYVEVTPETPGPVCNAEEGILCRITAEPDGINPSIPDLGNGDPGDPLNAYDQSYKTEQ